MIDLGATTLKDCLSFLSIPAYYASSIGIIVLIIRYAGKWIFKKVVEDIIKKCYEENLQKGVSAEIDKKVEDCKEELKEELREEIFKGTENLIENHSIKCKNTNLEHNDQRYLLRQEFKMFLDSQAKTNEKLEISISEIRNTCNQILLKLTD